MEIFSQSKVHRILDDHVVRRKESHSYFKKLEDAARALAVQQQFVDLGITFPTPAEENNFDAHFAGKTYHFAFDYPVEIKGKNRGRINMYAKVADKQYEQPALLSIHFDQQGESDLKDQLEDSVSLLAPPEALGVIFLNALRAGSQL